MLELWTDYILIILHHSDYSFYEIWPSKGVFTLMITLEPHPKWLIWHHFRLKIMYFLKKLLYFNLSIKSRFWLIYTVLATINRTEAFNFSLSNLIYRFHQYRTLQAIYLQTTHPIFIYAQNVCFKNFVGWWLKKTRTSLHYYCSTLDNTFKN